MSDRIEIVDIINHRNQYDKQHTDYGKQTIVSRWEPAVA